MKEVAGKFGSAIGVRVHPTDERVEMRKQGTAYGVYLNGTLLAAGPLVHGDRVLDRIQGELNRSRGGDAR